MHVLLSTIVLMLGHAAAADFQPLADIRAAAVAAVAHDAGTSADVTLDANLQMPRCGEPLRGQGGARSVAEVSCPGPTQWKLYVPVRIQRSQTVVVLSQSISAGQAVTREMIATEQRDAAAIIGGAIGAPELAIGRIAVRTLVSGNALVETDLVAPRIVRRGEAVTIVVRNSVVDARAPGRALGEAGLNERVNVENVSSHRIVQGIVRAGGEVEVSP